MDRTGARPTTPPRPPPPRPFTTGPPPLATHLNRWGRVTTQQFAWGGINLIFTPHWSGFKPSFEALTSALVTNVVSPPRPPSRPGSAGVLPTTVSATASQPYAGDTTTRRGASSRPHTHHLGSQPHPRRIVTLSSLRLPGPLPRPPVAVAVADAAYANRRPSRNTRRTNARRRGDGMSTSPSPHQHRTPLPTANALPTPTRFGTVASGTHLPAAIPPAEDGNTGPTAAVLCTNPSTTWRHSSQRSQPFWGGDCLLLEVIFGVKICAVLFGRKLAGIWKCFWGDFLEIRFLLAFIFSDYDPFSLP
mmetsp:Transcript_29306/g.62201  ORF Transcript_29306/g.62201 Transcript_29306/m.62201 type:complete len:304 (-) Transcript_29306:258-1169(-)